MVWAARSHLRLSTANLSSLISTLLNITGKTIPNLISFELFPNKIIAHMFFFIYGFLSQFYNYIDIMRPPVIE